MNDYKQALQIMKKPTPWRQTLLLFALFICAALVSSCSGDDENADEEAVYDQTIFMYMPWSGSDIYSYFLKNIRSFESAIENNRGANKAKLIVFVANSSTKAFLIDIQYKKGECVRDTLKSYTFSTPTFTTADGIASIVADMKAAGKTESYSMIIGCHGMGWISANTDMSFAPKKLAAKRSDAPMTRYFGHATDSEYRTDVATLAKGIAETATKMEFILFDDCYMSNIETAYELKDVCNYLIASTCEIMITGMPYENIGIDLINHDYKGVCEGFYDFYSTYSTPCGTIGVTDCSQVEPMAQIMKRINADYPDALTSVGNIQKLDGITPTVFFDFGSYVRNLVSDDVLVSEFDEQLSLLVPYESHTKTFYSMINERQTEIKTFSGLTISDPSLNPYVSADKTKTAWYKATH